MILWLRVTAYCNGHIEGRGEIERQVLLINKGEGIWVQGYVLVLFLPVIMEFSTIKCERTHVLH